MLFLDIGNSFAKLVTSKPDWKLVTKIPREDYLILESTFSSLNLGNQLIVSNNTDYELSFEHLSTYFDTIKIVERSIIEKHNHHYETPETLGIDRFLAAMGAYSIHKTACVSIDSGTAITIDGIDLEGRFLGGIIAPGLDTLSNALYAAAPKLPKQKKEIAITFPPKSTNSAMKTGLFNNFLNQVKYWVQKWKDDLGNDVAIICTGGDGQWLADQLGLNYDPFLVQKGMDYCLNT